MPCRKKRRKKAKTHEQTQIQCFQCAQMQCNLLINELWKSPCVMPSDISESLVAAIHIRAQSVPSYRRCRYGSVTMWFLPHTQTNNYAHVNLKQLSCIKYTLNLYYFQWSPWYAATKNSHIQPQNSAYSATFHFIYYTCNFLQNAVNKNPMVQFGTIHIFIVLPTKRMSNTA